MYYINIKFLHITNIVINFANTIFFIGIFMKPAYRSFSVTPDYSFHVRMDVGAPVYSMWHQHAEIEIFFTRGGQGTMVIGDEELPITEASQMVIIGSHVPHTMVYGNNSPDREVEAVVCHFTTGMFGSFYDLPEMSPIRELVEASARGITLSGKTLARMEKEMFQLYKSDYSDRMIRLLNILLYIARRKEYRPICSEAFSSQCGANDMSRLSKIYRFVMENYRRDVQVQELSDLIGLSKVSFCRYFKQRTGKTFMEFMIEVRIGNACKLLMEDEMNVTEIAYACGYNNISNFFHQFKAIKGCSPTAYQKNYFHRTKQRDEAG